jgi:RND family efflux transporter MFP subunit
LPVAATVAACSAAGPPRPASEGPPTRVAAAPAHEEPLAITYFASGTVRGRNTAVLTSKTTGYVRNVLVRPGDTVTSGQVLAELEANDLRAGVARARAGLEQAVEGRVEAEHALQAAQAAAKVAQTTHDRMKQLLAERAIAQQKFDDEEASYRAAIAQEGVARARLNAVTSSIDEAKAGLAESQATLGYSKIVAPFAGRVLERRVDPGALAAPGTPLLVVADEGMLRVEAAVEESRAPDVKVGDSATVQANALPAPLVGSVSEIVPSVDVASRAFLVKIDLPEGTTLRPGTFARVGFHVGTQPRLVVPTTAVNELGSLERVFVVQGDTARLRMVTFGDVQPPWVEVLSGLSPDESVVTQPPPALRDGSRVLVER